MSLLLHLLHVVMGCTTRTCTSVGVVQVSIKEFPFSFKIYTNQSEQYNTTIGDFRAKGYY